MDDAALLLIAFYESKEIDALSSDIRFMINDKKCVEKN